MALTESASSVKALMPLGHCSRTFIQKTLLNLVRASHLLHGDGSPIPISAPSQGGS